MTHKRWITTLLLVITALFTLTTVLPEPAEARFGGRKSFGSRGKRSFSTPQKTTQRQPGTTQAQGASKSRFGGGLMGMMGGLLLGGLIGSLFFGGMEGGMGLLEIILIGGALFFAFRWFKGRAAQQQAQTSPPYAARQSMDEESYGGQFAPPGANGNGHGNMAGEDEVTQGLQKIAARDPNFDETRFLEGAKVAFEMMQAAWCKGQIDDLKSLLTDRMLHMVEQQLQQMKDAGEEHRVENISFEVAEVNEAWQEAGQDYITARLMVNMIEVVNDRNGQLIEGNPHHPTSLEEFWTFTRPTGSDSPHWYLSAIQQPGEVARSNWS